MQRIQVYLFMCLMFFIASAYGSYKMPKDPGNLGGGSGGGTGGGTIQVTAQCLCFKFDPFSVA